MSDQASNVRKNAAGRGRWPRFATSLRAQLWLLWLFILLLSGFMAVILVGLYQTSSSVQVEGGRRATRAACESIQSLYAANRNERGSATSLEPGVLTVLVKEVLTDAAGIEGGIWERGRGFVAYAFPTHEGATPKQDVPATETPWIVEHAEESLATAATSESIRRGTREAVILFACPLPNESPQRAAWSMMRVRTATAEAYDRLAWGLALLLAFALVSGGWLAFALSRWSRAVVRLEEALEHHPVGELPLIEASGSPDIDRIVEALNTFTQRLAGARAEASVLGSRLVQAERLAALGRIAAGIAHEIRNPIAAMRLKAENALAHSPDRQQAALQTIVEQVDRLNALCDSLLSLARPLRLDTQEIACTEWLAACLQAFEERAGRDHIELDGDATVERARFDPAQLGRALDNLLINALQHTPRGGRIGVSMAASGQALCITVADTGNGVAQAVRGTLFEPFATGRTGGTGLGLAIAREIVEAHGGTIRLLPSSSGAAFEMDIPWRAS